MSKKLSYILLAAICVFTLFLHAFKHQEVPACINVDEAAFGYNAFSIVHTDRDEYGKFLPLRFKSFGENKLPVTTYFTAPFVALFGLNDFSTRALMNLTGILMPIFVFFLVMEMFENRRIAILSAFLIGVSPWMQVTARHVSESVLSTALLTLTFLFFLRYTKSTRLLHLIYSALFLGLGLFTHHTPKVFSILFVSWLLIHLWRNKSKYTVSKRSLHLLVFFIPLLFFVYTELTNPTNRISNLLFLSSDGFKLSIQELLIENRNRLLYNPLTYSAIYLTNQFLTYLSPNYLVINGDANPRFWLKGMYPISPLEYLFIFVGIYYLVKNKAKHKTLLVMMAIFAVSTAATVALDPSMTRSLYLIVPIVITAAYGVNFVYQDILKLPYKKLLVITLVGVYAFFTVVSWDFYYNHYFKRPLVTNAWQCGYRELADVVRQYYSQKDTFYITKELGQPYIMLLYYLRYDPKTYQRQASLSAPDQYGFGQVEKFDKFIFQLPENPPKNAIIVAHHNEVQGEGERRFADYKLIRTISTGAFEVFRIYETK